MKILLLSATAFEVAPLREAVQHAPEYDIEFLEAGIGMLATSFKLQQWLQNNTCDLIIQAGIAGAFDTNKHPIGSVVEVQSERIGDLGALFPDGHFEDVFELGLAHADAFPFQVGTLKNSKTYTDLVQVQSLSVNAVNGKQTQIDKISRKYAVDIESMEGAALFYTAIQLGIPFVQFRAISNLIEDRNKANWNIPLAIEKLNDFLLSFLSQILS